MKPICEYCKNWYEVPEGEGRGYCDQHEKHIHYWDDCKEFEETSNHQKEPQR